MIVIWGCSATRAPEFRHRNWCAKRKVTWCQQALGGVVIFTVIPDPPPVIPAQAGIYARNPQFHISR